MSDDLDSLVGLAEKVAREAGAVAYERRRAVERMPVEATKSSPTDVVTASDTAAELLIKARLSTARPHDAVVGEEGGSSVGDSGVVWVVDPIDGTVNYLYGIPQYAVSIAVQVDGVVAGGVVHHPVTGETWSGVHGQGARLDGRPIRVSRCAELSLALVGTGFSYQPGCREYQAGVVAELLPRVRDIRRHGAAALDLAAVACGRLDAYYERGLRVWDYSAGALIASEAGAVVTGFGGTPAGAGMTVAATPEIAGELIAHLERLNSAPWPD